MNSPKNNRRATASAGELDDYVAQLPNSRGRLPTFIGVAPAPPIMTGRPESMHSPDLAPTSAPVSVEASQPSPVSHVRPKAEPRPELPRVMAASKHTFDAVAITTDRFQLAAPEAEAAPRKGKGRAVFLATLAAAAVLALVAARRSPQLAPRLAAQVTSHFRPTLAAEPPFASSIDLPEVSPVVLAATATAERAVASVVTPAPRSRGHRHAPKHVPAP